MPLDQNIAQNKKGTFVNALSKGSPKSTVKIAQIDKPKEQQNMPTGDSKDMNTKISTELASFKEEMKNMMLDMNKSITQNVTSSISSKMEELDTKFSSMFTEYKADIKAVRVEVDTVRNDLIDISEKVTQIEKSVEFGSAKQKEDTEKQTTSLNKVKAEIDTKLQELNQKLLLMEKHERKYNLLFYGFSEEKEGENIYDNMRSVFVNDLQLDPYRVENMYFSNAHRLPAEKTDGPKPLIMRFAQYEDRELVLSNAYKLAGSKRRILSDLPVVMKKERARLATAAFKIRHEEDLQTRIKDKGLNVYLEVRKEKSDTWVKRVIKDVQE